MTIQEARASILKMLELEKDWDMEGADTIPEPAVDLAIKVVNHLDDFGVRIRRVAPTLESAVGVYFGGECEQDVEVWGDGDVIYGQMKPEIKVEDVTTNWRERLPELLCHEPKGGD